MKTKFKIKGLLAILKEETKTFHSSVEKVLIKEIKQLSSIEEYLNLLVKLYNFYYSIEDRIQELIDETILADIRHRKHIPQLELDLNFSNSKFTIHENPFCKKIHSTSYALGVLYVMEGSTLGGQIISGMLKKQLAIHNEPIFNYFSSYKEETNRMWTNFKHNLENASHKVNQTELLNGAKDTFIALENWLIHFKTLENTN